MVRNVATCDGGPFSVAHTTSTLAKTVDPVCGMSVDPLTTPYHAKHDGKTYDFCSAKCQGKFTALPKQYVTAAPANNAQLVEGGTWTCPMHPQIRQPRSGNCPLCGMALEPEAPSLDDKPNPELVDFTRRWWVSAGLAVPLLILTMGTEFLRLQIVAPAVSPWVQLALTTPIVMWAGAPFFARAWTSVKTGQLNMFTLIALGVGAAFVYSLVATLAPGLFPATFKMQDGMVPVYYEAAGFDPAP